MSVINGTALGDQINGGDGDDVLRGFGGADTLNGGAGADRFIWNAGEGSDRVEGGADADTAFLVGNAFVVSASAGHALVGNLAETIDLHGVETLNIHGSTAGASFVVGDLSATDVRQVVIGLDAGANAVGLTGAATGDIFEVQVLSGGTLRVFDTVGGVVQTIVASKLDAADLVTVDGGGGNDVITVDTPLGVVSPAPITARGGAGADTVTGSTGSDRLFGDAGDDQIASGGGGGADTIDGGGGVDIQLITGDDGVDTVALSASNGHLRETVGGVTSDVVNVETLIVRTLGQGDTITVGDLTSTQVRTVTLDLSAANGAQDGQADTVILTPGAGTEVSFTSSADGTGVQAVYTAAGALTQTVNITGLGATDTVKLAGGAADDVFSTVGLASTVRVAVDGGAGANRENFTGTGGNDLITLQANGTHAELSLNGTGVVDLVNVGVLGITPLEGADTVVVGDFAGTDINFVGVDLNNSAGVSDGEADSVTFNFSLTSAPTLNGGFFLNNPESLILSLGDGRLASVFNFEVEDRLTVNLTGSGPYSLGGLFGHADFELGATNDTVEWTLPTRAQAEYDTINGGLGEDTLEIGFDGDVRRFDQQGDWNITVQNTGDHDKLSLQHHGEGPFIESTYDTFSFERINVFGGAGADKFLVTDQTGTGLKFLNINVGGAGPDEDPDLVLIDGTDGADTISAVISTEAGELKIAGLPELVDVLSLRSGNSFVQDDTFIRAGTGDDVLDFTNHAIGRGLVHLDGGIGNDTMTGGKGSEAFEFHSGAIFGHDGVDNFSAHAFGDSFGNEPDLVRVNGGPDHSFADLIANHHIFQSGFSDVVIIDGLGASLTLTNTTLVGFGALTAADFLFV